MPPKNMISVSRKTHIPSVALLTCCSLSSNWCATWEVRSIARSANDFSLLFFRVGVCFLGHDGSLVKVEGGGRRFPDVPLEALGAPWLLRRTPPVLHLPGNIDQ